MSKPVIHLLSIAGSDRPLAAQLGLGSVRELVSYVRRIVGPAYRVTAHSKLLNHDIDDRRGGRRDDAERIEALQSALADDRVTALVPLRGGAWLTRLLHHVNFDVLKTRKRPLHAFGFSELTTLVNILGRYPKVRAFYDVGPAFLLHALRRRATMEFDQLSRGLPSMEDPTRASKSAFALGWAKGNFNLEFTSHLLDVMDIIERHASNRLLSGRLVQGAAANGHTIKVVGGCLSVLVTLLGTPFQRCIEPRGRWLALEDFREEPYRLDRYLAHLKLAGFFESCAGLLLGDFHRGEEDLTAALVELLKYHLPRGRRLPVIAHCNFGHGDACAPVPLNRPLRIVRGSRSKTVTLHPAR